MVLCAAALIINLDNTILNVALPILVRDLHATTSQLQWIVDSYAMVLAGLLLTGGSLADRFGRRLFFVTGLAVFAAGSAGAALAGSAAELIAGRAVMGVGAALTIPSSLSIISDMFPSQDGRARAIGAWAATIGLGIALGPIAGGLLLGKFWWGSIFLVNVPIAIAAIIGALLVVPSSRNTAAERPDPGGAVLSVTGLGLLLWAIIEAPVDGWSSGIVAVTGLVSLAVLAAFAAWEVRSSHPMLNPAFFANRRFSVAAAAEALATFGLLGSLFLQTQFLQSDLAYSPLQAGLRILPLAGVLILTAAASPVVTRVIGTKFTAAAGLAAIAGGLARSAAVSTPTATYGVMLPGMLLIGLGAGLLLPAATNSVVTSVPAGDSGIGSAANAVALQVGGALGVAVLGSALSTRYQDRMTSALAGHHIPAAIMHVILGSLGGALTAASRVGGLSGALLAQAARAAFMSGNQVALVTGAAAALGGACLMLALLPSPPPSRHPAARLRASTSPQSGDQARREETAEKRASSPLAATTRRVRKISLPARQLPD
jgi:EmrB/QacA subfamily drug resistance transporter